MAKLVLKGEKGPSEVELGTTPLNFGRRPDNNIVLADPAVSGRHAQIVCVEGQYFIEDLKSSNGTLVNGQRVTRLLLKHGDKIKLGQQEVAFVDIDQAAEMLGTLVIVAPPKQEKPKPAAPAPDDALPRFIIQPDPPAPTHAQSTPPTRPVPAMPAAPPPPAPAPPPPAAEPPGARTANTAPTDVNMLDHLVGSIRSHREREQRERELKQAQVKVEWEKTLTYAEQMKQKVGGDPRIKYFGISRSANDVMIRFQRDPKSPLVFVLMSLYHPDGQKDHAINGIWFRRTGEPDRCFQSADEAASELVREMAFLIA